MTYDTVGNGTGKVGSNTHIIISKIFVHKCIYFNLFSRFKLNKASQLKYNRRNVMSLSEVQGEVADVSFW